VTSMRIAMIGLRGLPARAGGVERHVEELATRLVDRGHEVTVFCRPGYAPEVGGTYRGIKLAQLPTVKARGGEAFVHSGLSACATLGNRFDVAHFHAVGPGLFTPLTRALGRCAIVQTIHGLDDQRAKWGGAAQRVLRAGTLLSAHVPDEVVVVSRALVDHYRERYGRYTTYIGNGVPVPERVDFDRLQRFGLEPQGYVAFVGRMVPEKDPALLLRAFRHVETDQKLVLVGDSSHTDGYMDRLRELAAEDPRVVLTGYQYGDDLAALFAGARLFVQPSLLEGLPITLLEAAAYGLPVLASDIAPHLEVLGDEGGAGRLVFRAGDLADLTAALSASLAADQRTLRATADELRDDVVRRYDWDVATDLLEQAYLRARSRRHGVAKLVPETSVPVDQPVREVVAH
jgi:glycosyltransferase involved in cell wall biosynthesis